MGYLANILLISISMKHSALTISISSAVYLVLIAIGLVVNQIIIRG